MCMWIIIKPSAKWQLPSMWNRQKIETITFTSLTLHSTYLNSRRRPMHYQQLRLWRSCGTESAVAKNLNRRLPLTDAVTLATLLDPSTYKDLVELDQQSKIELLAETVVSHQRCSISVGNVDFKSRSRVLRASCSRFWWWHQHDSSGTAGDAH